MPQELGHTNADVPGRAVASVAAMQRELRASPQWQVVCRIDTFSRSVRLLEGNAEELRHAVTYLTEDPRSLLLQAMDAKPERDRWLENVGRLLHNIVAAATTLVEHTYKLHHDLRHADRSFQGYADRKKALKEAGIVQFVRGLRNFFLHYEYPSIVYIERQAEAHRWSRHIALDRNELLNWEGWKPPVRSFLADGPEDVEIGPVIDQYMNVIRDFYDWFGGQLEEIHRDDYAFVNGNLAAIRRADAPHVFAMLREYAARIEDGSMSIDAALEQWMKYEDRLMLEALRTESLPSWLESALHHLGQTYGEIPQDIATRFVNASRR